MLTACEDGGGGVAFNNCTRASSLVSLLIQGYYEAHRGRDRRASVLERTSRWQVPNLVVSRGT